MEAVAYVAGESWTDLTTSVSPVITELLQGLNDTMSDADRHVLRPLIPTLPGTVGDKGLEAARSWMAMDWHCRVWPSAWLRSSGCAREAAELEGVMPITDAATTHAAMEQLERARIAARALRIAAGTHSIEDGLASTVAACEGDDKHPAIVAVRARIRSGDVGPAVRAARQDVPTACRWDEDRRARWTEAWDAAVYAIAVASAATQIAAVRALSASSVWNGGWSGYRRCADEKWDAACAAARSIGRDAALVVAWQAAWPAAIKAEGGTPWTPAAEAAAAAVRPTAVMLQRSAVGLVAALTDPLQAYVRR